MGNFKHQNSGEPSLKNIRVKSYGPNQHSTALRTLAGLCSQWARVTATGRFSLESQQLQAAGVMPSSDLAIVDLRTIRQAELAALVSTADDPNQAHELLILKHTDETAMQRSDREELEKVLRDNGFHVFNTPESMAKYAEENINKFPEETDGLGTGSAKATGGLSKENFEGDGISCYRKKPVTVEVFHWVSGAVPVGWLAEAIDSGKVVLCTEKRRGGTSSLFIETLEGRMEASVGDYIIRGVMGEIYPCKPDIFHMTYEAV
jgi:hypothetical protein